MWKSLEMYSQNVERSCNMFYAILKRISDLLYIENKASANTLCEIMWNSFTIIA